MATHMYYVFSLISRSCRISAGSWCRRPVREL